MLNFVTAEEFDKIRELEEKAAFDKLNQQEEYREPIENYAAEVATEDESVGREKYLEYEQEKLDQEQAEEEQEVIETEEEMAHKAQKSGFNFMSGKPSRSIASKP